MRGVSGCPFFFCDLEYPFQIFVVLVVVQKEQLIVHRISLIQHVVWSIANTLGKTLSHIFGTGNLHCVNYI